MSSRKAKQAKGKTGRKLKLSRETLRDLGPQKAGELKGGQKAATRQASCTGCPAD